MDLIILALIAGFIVYRLYVTLGENTGYQGDGKKPSASVVDLKTKQNHKSLSALDPVGEEDVDPVFLPAVKKIRVQDPDFSLKNFEEGATMAFEMVLEAYAFHDMKTLKKLLAPDIYKAFKAVIDARKLKGHILENTLVRVEKVVIEDISIQQEKAQVRVQYTTEQVPVIKDQAGDIIEGNPNQIDQVIDTWTFERSLVSQDPNWVLVSTKE